MKLKAAAGFALILAFAAPADARTWRVEAGQSASLIAAFSQAQANDDIRIERGTYALSAPLSLTQAGVKVRGAGADQTILSGAGLSVAAQNVRLEGFTIQNAPGDAISATACNGLQISDVAVSSAGGSGVHVSGCSNVLIEKSSVSGAGVSGFLLEGVRNAIVQQNSARGAYIGLALANVGAVDTTASSLSGNAIGAAVYDTPLLAQAGGVRLFQNTISDNNGRAAAPSGDAFATVPSGLGVLVMGAKNVFMTDNDIGGHGSANVLVMSYPGSANGAAFVAISRNVMISGNRFGAVGSAPQAPLTDVALGAPAPDVIWDGADTYYSASGPRTEIPRIVMRDNRSSRGGIGAFVSLSLPAAGTPFSEAAPDRAFPPLVNLEEPPRVRIN